MRDTTSVILSKGGTEMGKDDINRDNDAALGEEIDELDRQNQDAAYSDLTEKDDNQSM
jgi:hypothetical protein